MQVAAKTDMGLVRQSNQDYFIAENQEVGAFPNLFLIADGVGSNVKSGYASKHTCDFVFEQLKRTQLGIDYIEELSKVYRMANTDLFYRILANSDYTGMGTTLVMGTIENDRLIVGNVGDSRCYHITNRIRQLTRDHSVAEELVRTNSLSRDSDMYKQYKHQLTRAIGAQKTITPDFFETELNIGDYILFCTDGITNMLSDKELFDIIKQNISLDEKVTSLIEHANLKGGLDNMAVILLYIDYIDKSLSIFEREKRENEKNNKDLLDLIKEKNDERLRREREEEEKYRTMSELKIDVDDFVKNDNTKIYNFTSGRSRKRKDLADSDYSENNERKEGDESDGQ